MTYEEKIYYETFFLEYKEKLLKIIKDYNIGFIEIKNKESRPLISDKIINNQEQNILNIWETNRTSIFIEDRTDNNLFEIKVLERGTSDYKVLDEIYLVFCEVFKRLIEEGAVWHPSC